MLYIDFGPVPGHVISVLSLHPQWWVMPFLVVSSLVVHHSLFVGMFVYVAMSLTEGRGGNLSALCLPGRHGALRRIGVLQLGGEFHLLLETVESSL